MSKSILIVFCLLILSVAGNGQSVLKHKYLAPGNILGYPSLDKTTISIDESGIPVYFWILRYKGKTIGLRPTNYAFATAQYLTTEVAEFPILKDVFTAEELVELISKYKFKLDGDYIHIRTHKAKSKEGKVSKPELPDYLKFTVEKLSFK